MRPLKFIHAADLHLGRPFSGLRESRPTLADLFLGAGYTAWDRIVQAAIDEKAEFVTLGGDVFDSAYPSLKARLAFRDAMNRLSDAGIPVFVALGNHDPLETFPDSLRSLEAVHIFGPQPEGVKFHRQDGAQAVVIYGVSFEKTSTRENLANRFKRNGGDHSAIGVVHANVSGTSGHDDYAPCSLDDLRLAGMDVWCLGHVHQAQVLWKDPLIVYAGASQGAHIKEVGPRGFYLIEVDSRTPASARFIQVSPVVWEQVELDVAEALTDEDLIAAVEGACRQFCQGEATAEAFVVRINLTGKRPGKNPVWGDRAEELFDMLGERLEQLPVPVFVESIRDNMASHIDLESFIQGEGFLAEYIRIAREVSVNSVLREQLLRHLDSELLGRQWRRYLHPNLDTRTWRDAPQAMTEILADAQEIVAELFLEVSAGPR